MADDKPFEATASRLARAKREGDLPRSQDLNAVVALGCASVGLVAVLPFLGAAARSTLVDAASARALHPGPYAVMAASVGATVVCALGGAVLATYLQARAFTFVMPSVKFEKLAPLQGLKRILSRDSLAHGVKAIVLSSAVGGALAPAVRRAFSAGGGIATPEALATLAARALATIVATALGVAALFAVLDVMFERAKWRRRLRMSFDELKRDHKQSEGDPQLKGRRRQAHRTLVRGSIGRVADAAFVVTNPTHVAIALEYRPPEVAVPRVIVRAIDEGALQVKRRARELRVPIVENVAVARALLATTAIGEFIAPDLYAAVAAIVASHVSRLSSTVSDSLEAVCADRSSAVMLRGGP